MSAGFRIKFDYQAMGDTFLRSGGTKSLLASESGRVAAHAGYGCTSHLFEGSDRPHASVWTRGKTDKQVESAKLALEGAM